MASQLTYKIESFEGPLDLLLTLVEKNKMEITDIRISEILEQYLAYLEQMKKMDMEITGEFIVMASELMLIKSKMLLPTAENEEEDPRQRLALALLEYKRTKEEAKFLGEQYAIFSARFVKDTDEIKADHNHIEMQDVMNLKRALFRLFSKKEHESVLPQSSINPIIQKTIVPVSEKIRSVTEHLAHSGCIPFTALFSDANSKSEMVAIFIAVLALIKDGHILLEKRLTKDTDESDISGLPDEYIYEYYCSLDADFELSGDYIKTYEEMN